MAAHRATTYRHSRLTTRSFTALSCYVLTFTMTNHAEAVTLGSTSPSSTTSSASSRSERGSRHGEARHGKLTHYPGFGTRAHDPPPRVIMTSRSTSHGRQRRQEIQSQEQAAARRQAEG